VRNDEQQLNSAQATVNAAKSNVTANGSLSGQGLQSSAVDQSKAQEAVALAQAQQIRVQISKATIVSPVDGVVVNRNINPGEYPGSREIFTIQQVNPIYAVLHASGAQVAAIPNGAAAGVLVQDIEGEAHFTGHVIGVLNEINPGSTDFQVKVILPNPKRTLRPGMVVQGMIAMPNLHGVRVPSTTFTDDNHDALMTVQPDGAIKTVKVAEVGSDGDDSVVTGIESGTRVVTNGQMAVGDGEKVSYR
jgi:membrane fusion protein, multidrug efflux system